MKYLEVISDILLKRSDENIVLENGVRLYCKMPSVGSDAWLHSVFSPLMSFELLEEQLEMPIPEVYRSFLMECNGMMLFSSSIYFYGYRYSYVREGLESWQPYGLEMPNKLERLEDADDDVFFIGGYNWDGSLLYIRHGESTVYRCSRESISPLNSWDNLENLLRMEANRIDELFDINGYELNEDNPTIPS